MTPVKSSNIKAIDYDPTTKTLTIEFNSGGLYEYHDVTEAEHNTLLKADSIGSHFHQHIKSKKFTKKEGVK